jgi:hypothetical protein
MTLGHSQPRGSQIPRRCQVLGRHHTHFSPHLLATNSHNQPQVPNGEKPQIALRRNGFHG